MAGSKGSKYYDIFLDYAIQLKHNNHGKVIDKYGFELLIAIQETNSIKLAADKMGVSYRKAWGNIQDIEKGLNIKLVEKQRGGATGGNTQLSKDGQELLLAYNELQTEFNEAIHKITRKFFSTINE